MRVTKVTSHQDNQRQGLHEASACKKKDIALSLESVAREIRQTENTAAQPMIRAKEVQSCQEMLRDSLRGSKKMTLGAQRGQDLTESSCPPGRGEAGTWHLSALRMWAKTRGLAAREVEGRSGWSHTGESLGRQVKEFRFYAPGGCDRT